MSANNEARRAALEARELVRQVRKDVMAPEPGRILLNPDRIRAVVSEEMAWALLGGVEPRLSVDEEGNFRTITGYEVLSDTKIEYEPLFGKDRATLPSGYLPMQAEGLAPTLPEDRWSRFLAADDQALGLLSRLEAVVSGAQVPEDFALPLQDYHKSAPPEEAEEQVRRLAYLLTTRDTECLALVAELCRRRDGFVWGPDGPPWAARNR